MMTGEARKPPVNRGPSEHIFGKLFYLLRRFLDLQASSVASDVAPWLSTRSGLLLEVGCGEQPYRSFLTDKCSYVGLDWASANPDFSIAPHPDVVYYVGSTFPFDEQSFDAIFHTEVLEHVRDYRTFLTECRRVLKPGGEMMFTVPFQARFHYIPYDYWRFTKSGLESILAETGFSGIHISPRGTDVVVAAYKFVSVFYRLAYGGPLGKVTFIAFSWLVILSLCLAHVCMALMLGSSDDCLGYSVIATRPRS
jgi:SAM-dependent methyltransferase